jgi:hypothetical protein
VARVEDPERATSSSANGRCDRGTVPAPTKRGASDGSSTRARRYDRAPSRDP